MPLIWWIPAHRGKGIGKLLCAHSLEAAKAAGYRAMQFNLVVSTNTAAIRTWESFGFNRIGVVPEGFFRKVLGTWTPTFSIGFCKDFKAAKGIFPTVRYFLLWYQCSKQVLIHWLKSTVSITSDRMFLKVRGLIRHFSQAKSRKLGLFTTLTNGPKRH